MKRVAAWCTVSKPDIRGYRGRAAAQAGGAVAGETGAGGRDEAGDEAGGGVEVSSARGALTIVSGKM